ncbi:MAG: endonuclease [Bacilli bacterium]|nr:endonuclease [Bacilli bacterium]
MKRKIIPAVSIGALSLLSISLCFKNNDFKVVEAYSIANLPTTIDLNDNTAEQIRNYYSGLNSLSESERQGTNLLKNLKPILANGQKYYSYDSNTKIWQMYEITDRDWEKSPASSTEYGTYNSGTNTITNYQYGTSNSDRKNNPYIHALYNNRNIDNMAQAWGNHEQDGWGINQEHIWAKSHGFDTKGSDSSGGARGDPMHLWAGNGWANHEHSNYFFAFVDKDKTYSDAGTKYQTAYGNLTGYSKTVGGNETVFEPQDSDKGDIARSIFYMAARYNYYSGSDSAPIDGNNPNLVLLNNLSENSRTGTSSATNPFGMGLLSDLLAWNRLDPVDEYEIHRNNLLYNNYTNNRNPFIDFPEWAEFIWGTADEDGKNYDATPTGVAKPSTDSISKINESFDVSVNHITFSIGDTFKVSGDCADADITWSVDDPTIVSLSKNTSSNKEEITVTALANGVTAIHASATQDGNPVNKTINVKVTDLIVTSLSLSGMKTGFKVDEEFTTEGLVVIANYKNGTSETITSGYTVSKPNMSIAGEQEVIITYEDVTASYKINIVKPGLPPYLIYIAIGGGVVLLIVIIVIFANSSKKTRKKMISAAKKGAKAYKKSNSKKR